MEQIIVIIIRIAAVYIAYRIGKAAGVVAERERRQRLEAETERRLWQRLHDVTEKDPELWDTEIDA